MIVCASIAKPEPVATPAQEMLRTRSVICSAARVTLSRASSLRLLPAASGARPASEAFTVGGGARGAAAA